ncbi:MAG: hypothetical protein MMC23_009721 [Stictis urceolatum]|nr:hypothetical protein [Stictis urceolata]
MAPIPVIVGIGDVKNKSSKVEDAFEPAQLILQTIELAIKDSGLPQLAAQRLRSSIDSIDCVATWTWPYPDLPGLLAKKLGVRARHSFCSGHGGNQPAKLLDDAARRLSKGQCKVAVVTGGEALASLSACTAAKKMPPPGWTQPKDNVDSVFTPSLARMAHSESIGAIHSVGLPIHVYPMYENGFRASQAQSLRANHDDSAQLYADFAATASRNPFAWNYRLPAASKTLVGTVTKKNRMICFPYPLLMNAFNTVNLAATCILTTVDYADELGIPSARRIYPLGGAGTRESIDFWERKCFYESPAISASLDAALQVSGLQAQQIDLFDFYSCFPIVPKLACKHLSLPLQDCPKPITLLGGLTSFGGAGNNYSMHAITEMVRQLRQGKGTNGLVLANGGCLTYQHVICLSSRMRHGTSSYPASESLPDVLSVHSVPAIDETADGEATIETYTVAYSREGMPELGHIVGRLKSTGHRFVANHADTKTLELLSSDSEEQVGRHGWVRNDAGSRRNLFTFERASKI